MKGILYRNGSIIIFCKEWNISFLVENGSDDNSLQILKPYIDDTLRYETKRRLQLEMLQNFLLLVSPQAEWIMSIDVDDFAYSRPWISLGNTLAS